MKGTIQRVAISMAAVIIAFATAIAKDYDITLSCDPEGALVYLDGQQLIAHTTPAVWKVSKKQAANKTLMLQFVKDGYKPKTVIVKYTKKELEYNPIVYCKLEKEAEKHPAVTADPTVTIDQSRQRVDRQNAGQTDMERSIIRWFFDSDPRGARIFTRVISSVPDEVKNTNETYLTTTPIEETRGFNIQGLTYDNSRDVTIEIKVTKRGYEDQVKRFNVRQALDQQEISGFFELVAKDIPPVSAEE